MHVFVRKMRKLETRSNASHLSKSRNSELIAHRKTIIIITRRKRRRRSTLVAKEIFRVSIYFYICEYVSLCGTVYEKWLCKMEFSLKIKECLVWRRFDGLIACVHAWLCKIGNLYLLSIADNDATVATTTTTATAAICVPPPVPVHGCHRHSHFRARDAFFPFQRKNQIGTIIIFYRHIFSSSPQPCKILLWWWWLLLLLFLR